MTKDPAIEGLMLGAHGGEHLEVLRSYCTAWRVSVGMAVAAALAGIKTSEQLALVAQAKHQPPAKAA
jgi:hypothetical protein